jgi:hypothetical protein
MICLEKIKKNIFTLNIIKKEDKNEIFLKFFPFNNTQQHPTILNNTQQHSTTHNNTQQHKIII